MHLPLEYIISSNIIEIILHWYMINVEWSALHWHYVLFIVYIEQPLVPNNKHFDRKYLFTNYFNHETNFFEGL